MLQQEICPDCQILIPAERMDEEMVVCTCGYTKSMSRTKFEYKKNKASNYTIIGFSLLLITSFIHTAKWGKESIKVTPLEISRVFGTISPDQALSLGDMSFEKNFFIQAAEMYDIFLKKYPDNIDANKKMGMLLFRQKRFADSTTYLKKYFLGGGEDQVTLFSYGKSLSQTQNLANAEKVFLKLIKNDPEIYQTTVVQALVDLYIAQNKLVKAKNFITSLIKPGYQIPNHLREQKDFIKELIKKS